MSQWHTKIYVEIAFSVRNTSNDKSKFASYFYLSSFLGDSLILREDQHPLSRVQVGDPVHLHFVGARSFHERTTFVAAAATAGTAQHFRLTVICNQTFSFNKYSTLCMMNK